MLGGWEAERLGGWEAGRLRGWEAGRLRGWEAGGAKAPNIDYFHKILMYMHFMLN